MNERLPQSEITQPDNPQRRRFLRGAVGMVAALAAPQILGKEVLTNSDDSETADVSLRTLVESETTAQMQERLLVRELYERYGIEVGFSKRVVTVDDHMSAAAWMFLQEMSDEDFADFLKELKADHSISAVRYARVEKILYQCRYASTDTERTQAQAAFLEEVRRDTPYYGAGVPAPERVRFLNEVQTALSIYPQEMVRVAAEGGLAIEFSVARPILLHRVRLLLSRAGIMEEEVYDHTYHENIGTYTGALPGRRTSRIGIALQERIVGDEQVVFELLQNSNLAATLHHELLHRLDDDNAAKDDFSIQEVYHQWYAKSDALGAEPYFDKEKNRTLLDIFGVPRGFARPYGRTNVAEDRATIAEALLDAEAVTQLEFRAQSDQALAYKIAAIKAYYEKRSHGVMNAQYWALVRKGDIAGIHRYLRESAHKENQ